MQIGTKHLLVIGDRVLIKPINKDERTNVGLYLPQSVVEKQPVQSGIIVETGPGLAIPNFQPEISEPWQKNDANSNQAQVKFIPVQAEIGDHALFLKKDAIEIHYQGEEYYVVPQQAILMLVREDA
ncbi:MAG: co-chaperone GroES [Sumerlaeia bacterium]